MTGAVEGIGAVSGGFPSRHQNTKDQARQSVQSFLSFAGLV